jgi:proline iminopeptidase
MTQDAQSPALDGLDGLGAGFEVEVEGEVEGGLLRGWLAGSGPPVLLLHGGPGLSTGYLAPVVAELSEGYQVATYQQRGLAPSTAQAPYDVGTQADDVTAVLDRLGWDRAVVVGHSWGGHLLLHVLADHPDRVAAAVVIDPLGGVGDGGGALFVAELLRRLPPGVADRVNELEARLDSGAGTLAEADEQLRLLWPSYFNDPSAAPVMPNVPQSIETNQKTFESVQAELPGLAARLSGLPVPTLFVHGAGSPMPVTASTETAEAMGPAARVQVVQAAGHFVWHESPGVVRAAVDELSGA